LVETGSTAKFNTPEPEEPEDDLDLDMIGNSINAVLEQYETMIL
jgi:hypothetical protein